MKNNFFKHIFALFMLLSIHEFVLYFTLEAGRQLCLINCL